MFSNLNSLIFKMEMINYKNVRNVTSHRWFERALSEHLCMALSPFISILFIKYKVTPNTVTLLMIFCGIVAPLLFMVDNIYVRYLSSLIFVLWFVFDCSDGEVARFTQTFSKHGRDLDYLSHVSCHSLFVMAIWKIYVYQSEYLLQLTLFFFLLLASELFYRLKVVYMVYVEETGTIYEPTNKIKAFILLNLTYFPNYVVFFPFLYCVTYTFSINIFPIFLLFFLIYLLVILKAYFFMIKRFYIN